MNVEIAQRLAELRRERGFSQEGLAEQLGLSRQAVSKWERAESAPDMGNLIALADLYEVTLDELLRVSPEVEEDMRFESQERAESVEAEAAAAAEAALAAAARAEAAAATAVEAPETPKVVVEVSAPAAGPGNFPPSATVSAGGFRPAAPMAPGHAGPPGQGTPHGFAPSPCGTPSYQGPATGYEPPTSPQAPSAIPPASSVPIAPPPAPRPKDPLQSFPYPLLCAVIFLLAGFCFGWWHPAWVIFLTIPFYYWVVNTLEADPAYRAWVEERRSGAPTATTVPFSASDSAATGAPAPFAAEEPAGGAARSADDAADADSSSEGGAR